MKSFPYPTFLQAIWLLGLVLLASMVLSIPMVVLLENEDAPLDVHPAAMALTNFLAIGSILLLNLKRANTTIGDVLLIVPIPFSFILPMCSNLIGAMILISELDNLLVSFLPMPDAVSEIFISLAAGQKSLWGSFLLLVIIAPITEEALFRGFIFRGFLSHYTVRTSILVSALLFGLFHFNPWQFFGGAILGAIFAWWFVRTGSLLPCLLGHALNNSVPLILLGVLGFEIPGMTSDPPGVEFQPLWLDLVGLLMVGWGIWRLFGLFDEFGFIANQEELAEDVC